MAISLDVNDRLYNLTNKLNYMLTTHQYFLENSLDKTDHFQSITMGFYLISDEVINELNSLKQEIATAK